MPDTIQIPDKPAFKAAEVCDLLKVPAYVLKSWENEFKDLGVAKTAGGPRVYRREDVERALRIRQLVLQEGLTLAGVRRRLEQEAGAPSPEDQLIAEIAASARPTPAPVAVPAPGAAAPTAEWRERLTLLREGLRELAERLSRPIGNVHAAAGVSAAPSTGASAATGTPAPRRARAPRKAPAQAATPQAEPTPGAPDPAPSAPAPSPSPARELTVVPDDDAPSLFRDDN